MKQRVSTLLREKFGREVVLEKPRDRSFGHFATPIAFSLAKELRKSPMIIAEELASSFDNHEMFSSVESVKGYLNFRLSESFLSEYADWALENSDDFGKQEKQDWQFVYLAADQDATVASKAIGVSRGSTLSYNNSGLGNTVVFDTLSMATSNYRGMNVKSASFTNDSANLMSTLTDGTGVVDEKFVDKKKK